MGTPLWRTWYSWWRVLLWAKICIKESVITNHAHDQILLHTTMKSSRRSFAARVSLITWKSRDIRKIVHLSRFQNSVGSCKKKLKQSIQKFSCHFFNFNLSLCCAATAVLSVLGCSQIPTESDVSPHRLDIAVQESLLYSDGCLADSVVICLLSFDFYLAYISLCHLFYTCIKKCWQWRIRKEAVQCSITSYSAGEKQVFCIKVGR